MAGQVRVLQLEAGQELETKLFRIEKGKVLVLYKSLIPRSVSKLFENLYLYFRVGWQQVYVGAKLTFLTSWFLSFWCFLRKTGPKNCICTICSMFVLYFRNRNFLLFIKGENLKFIIVIEVPGEISTSRVMLHPDKQTHTRKIGMNAGGFASNLVFYTIWFKKALERIDFHDLYWIVSDKHRI